MLQNNHEWGDLWNGEDLSIYSIDDSPLPVASKPGFASTNPSTTSIDKASPAYSYSKSESALPVTPANVKDALKAPSISSERTKTSGDLSAKPGFRAAEAYIRPSPIATNGRVLKHGFDLRNCTFTMSLDASQPLAEAHPTELFLPEYHFGRNAMNVEVSGGRWTVDIDEVDGGTMQVLRWWHAVGEQNITVKGIRQRQGLGSGQDEEVGYLEQYRRSLCSVM
jgi:Glycoside hydrolase family 5 C-terminal domain